MWGADALDAALGRRDHLLQGVAGEVGQLSPGLLV
jgi:hypothetical protein